MNINKITAKIGKTFSENQDILDPLIKQPKKLSKDQTGYVVKMVFDIPKDEIYFQLISNFNSHSAQDFLYFGNNSRQGSQYYLVRDVDGLHYLLQSTISDFYQTLLKYRNDENEIIQLLKKLYDNKLVFLGDKKGQGKVNLNKLSIVEENTKINVDKKSIHIGDRKYNFEKFIQLFIDDENPRNKIMLVLPTVIDEDEKEIVLSKQDDYEKIVIKENKLNDDVIEEKIDNKIQKICHICGESKIGVSSKYSRKFSGSGINKIFTTTKINHSTFNKKYSYDDNYGICKTCYNDLLTGEKIVSSNFKTTIAGENVFIIPEGLMQDFNYQDLEKIRLDIDLAFSFNKATEWIDGIDYSYKEEMKHYSINFIFYRSDGKSLSVLQTIEDIPIMKLIQVSDVIGENREALEGHIKNFVLGNIYSLIPVRTNKKGEQLNIKRVISLYDAILSGYLIDVDSIFRYFTEALDVGIKQLNKSNTDNYNNLNINYYKKNYKDYPIDFFIKYITMGYLVLLKVIEQLGISSKSIFKKEVEINMEKINTTSEKINNSIEETEMFLEKQGFLREGKALFYLGMLMNRVALAQYKKGHKTKPILKKIQFQGMKQREIIRLYYDVIEKLKQYEKLDLYVEGLMNRFHFYYEDINGSWTLDEHSNIFYVMAGYSYLVGRKDSDANEQVSEPDNIDDGM